MNEAFALTMPIVGNVAGCFAFCCLGRDYFAAADVRVYFFPFRDSLSVLFSWWRAVAERDARDGGISRFSRRSLLSSNQPTPKMKRDLARRASLRGWAPGGNASRPAGFGFPPLHAPQHVP